MTLRADMKAVLEELRESGPLHINVLRERLGFASRSRADVAVRVLVDEGAIERPGAHYQHYRVTGDAREVVMFAQFDRAVRRLTPPSWTWKGTKRARRKGRL